MKSKWECKAFRSTLSTSPKKISSQYSQQSKKKTFWKWKEFLSSHLNASNCSNSADLLIVSIRGWKLVKLFNHSKLAIAVRLCRRKKKSLQRCVGKWFRGDRREKKKMEVNLWPGPLEVQLSEDPRVYSWRGAYSYVFRRRKRRSRSNEKWN